MRDRYLILYITILMLSAVSLNCGTFGRRYEKKEVTEYRINVSGKNKISLVNTSGNIKITPSLRDDSAGFLIVKAEKLTLVRKKDLDKRIENLKVSLDTSSDVISITGEIEKHRGLTFNFSNLRTEINFELKLPENIKLTISNTNGKVDLSNVGNDIDVSVTNGSESFNNIYGNTTLDITNGSIKGSVDSSKSMKLNTVNGSVNLTLDSLFKGRIQAEVVNGKITHEGLNFSQLSEDRKKFKGTLGSSSNEINIEVVNGKIRLQGK